MSSLSMSAVGASTAYDFTQLNSSQIQQAASDLQGSGYLTSDEADLLKGLGSESSFSPVNRDSTDAYSGKEWESIKRDVLSSLQNEISTGKAENLGQEGKLYLSEASSLYQKLSAYEKDNYGAESTNQNSVNTSV